VFFSKGRFGVLLSITGRDEGRYVNKRFREGGEDAGKSFHEGDFEFVGDF